MQVLFESRTNIDISGKVYFFQHNPVLHPEPVLGPDSFVDGAGTSIYGSVLRDGGVYRMWYQAWPRDWNGANGDLIGYAESNNGIDWHKPKLGLVDYSGKGRDNNLVDLSGHSPSVFIDPESPPTHRYRATLCTGPGPQGARKGMLDAGYFTAHSADGLHWEYDRLTPQWRSADVITSIYHPRQRRGIVAMKVTPRVHGIPRRSIWNAEWRDGHWSEARSALVPDEYDDIAAGARGYVSGDYYGMGMLAAGSGAVGFVWQFRHRLPRTEERGSGVFGDVDVSLAYQAEPGDRWLHVPGRADFIRHADLPSWGRDVVYTASCPVDVGDEQWLYVSAGIRSHGWYVDSRWKRDENRIRSLVDQGMYRIGIVRWPKWRLFGFRSDPCGVLDIKLGRLSQPGKVQLNYRCESGGSIRAEIPNRETHSLEQALPLRGDALSETVAWKAGDILPADPEKELVVRLHLDRAEVYAYDTLETGPDRSAC